MFNTHALRRWAKAPAFLLAGFLAACTVPGLAMKTYTAEEFFSGPKLALAQAIDRNDIAALRAGAKDVDLSAPGQRDMTLMWFAIMRSRFEAIKTLVQLGVDPDTQIAEGIGSALTYAFLSKDLRFLTVMLDGGLSPDHQAPKYELMLQRAIMDGQFQHVKLLVERGANVNLKDSIGGTALYSTITTNQPEIGIYLVEHGAGVNTFTTNGVTIGWAISGTIKRQQPGEMRTRIERLRDVLIRKGVVFPPDPPAKVREWMKSQGMKTAQ